MRTLKAALALFAALASLPWSAHADLTEGGLYRDITELNHPLAKSLVAIRQIGSSLVHLGNGFFWGPGGCYVVTNFHVAYADGIFPTGDPNWVLQGGRNFVVNARKHRVEVRADLDSSTGRFRRLLEGRVIRYGAFYRTPGAVNEAGNDVAVLKLYEPGSNTAACLGEEFLPKRARAHALFRDGIISDLNVIHLFATGRDTARVFVNTHSCKSAPVLTGGGTTATCELRGGASGSILFRSGGTDDDVVVGLVAAMSQDRRLISAANIGALNRNLRLGLESEGLATDALADFFKRYGEGATPPGDGAAR